MTANRFDKIARDKYGRFAPAKVPKRVKPKEGKMNVNYIANRVNALGTGMVWGVGVMPVQATPATKAPVKNHVFGSKGSFHKPTTQMLQYPMCCGALILYGFPSCPKNFEKDMNYYIAQGARQQKGMLCAIINHTQAAYGHDKVLQKLGFTFNQGGTNPTHDDQSKIFMYTKIIGKHTVDEKGQLKV